MNAPNLKSSDFAVINYISFKTIVFVSSQLEGALASFAINMYPNFNFLLTDGNAI